MLAFATLQHALEVYNPGGTAGMRLGLSKTHCVWGVRFGCRFQAKSEEQHRLQGFQAESQDQDLALTDLCVPYSLDSGTGVPRPQEKAHPPRTLGMGLW